MAEEPRLARSSAAASVRRWAALVASAAEVAQPSEQPAAWVAAAAEEVAGVVQQDAAEALRPEAAARVAAAVPRLEAAGQVGAAVQQPGAAGQVGAAVPRPEVAGRAGVAVQQPEAPDARAAHPSAAAWAPPYPQAQRLARLPRVRSARAMKDLQIAAR
jgi:hypothetical protein